MLATKIEDMKNEEGFTLIELLVVVIIIGILAAIAIPAFLNQRESAWRSSAESDTRNAAISMETFYTRARSEYPNSGPMDNRGGTAPIWYISDTGVISTSVAASPATDFAEVAVSDGVALVYTEALDGASYTITAFHNQIGDGTEAVTLYDSAAGGLQNDLVGAATAPTPPA